MEFPPALVALVEYARTVGDTEPDPIQLHRLRLEFHRLAIEGSVRGLVEHPLPAQDHVSRGALPHPCPAHYHHVDDVIVFVEERLPWTHVEFR